MQYLRDTLLSMREKELNIQNIQFGKYTDSGSDIGDIRYDDFLNFDKNGNELSLMDPGFIIPKSSDYDILDILNDSDLNLIYSDKTQHIRFLNLDEAICVYSSKSKKNLISKSKIKIKEAKFHKYDNFSPTYEKHEINESVIDFKHFSIWRDCKFQVNGFIHKYNNIYNGYELVILNDKMQIEDRAFYIKIR